MKRHIIFALSATLVLSFFSFTTYECEDVFIESPQLYFPYDSEVSDLGAMEYHPYC